MSEVKYRAGDYVLYDSKVGVLLDSIFHYTVCLFGGSVRFISGFEEVDPIPVDEDWLDFWSVRSFYDWVRNEANVGIQYVHELQNAAYGLKVELKSEGFEEFIKEKYGSQRSSTDASYRTGDGGKG